MMLVGGLAAAAGRWRFGQAEELLIRAGQLVAGLQEALVNGSGRWTLKAAVPPLYSRATGR
jgi:hypothetical protein